MRAVLKLIPLQSPPLKGEKVIFENEIWKVKHDLRDGRIGIEIARQFNSGYIGAAFEKLQRIVCQITSGVFINTGSNDATIPKQVPLHFDDYDWAIKNLENEIEITFMDAMGYCSHNNNPATSIATIDYGRTDWEYFIGSVPSEAWLDKDYFKAFVKQNFHPPKKIMAS